MRRSSEAMKFTLRLHIEKFSTRFGFYRLDPNPCSSVCIRGSNSFFLARDGLHRRDGYYVYDVVG